MEQRIRISGLLVAAGLLVQMITFIWSNPTAFLVFILIGGTLQAAGMLIYLYSLVSMTSKQP